MFVQELDEGGTVLLLRKLLPNGNWLTCFFEKTGGKFRFLKKTTTKKWWDRIEKKGGKIKNITDPNVVPENIFPDE